MNNNVYIINTKWIPKRKQ